MTLIPFVHRLWKQWHQFWFRPISSAGFGLMRIGFGMMGIATYVMQWTTLSLYYSDEGMLSPDVLRGLLRTEYRFSLLDTFHSPLAVQILAFALIASLALVMIGILTRWALLVSVVLMFSFHEYAPVLLDGGDTLLRNMGLILLVSPCHRSFSLASALRRYASIIGSGKDIPASTRTMPVWPYRLLLWQMVCLYTAAFIEKMNGAMWRDGSAVGSVLLHGTFSRISEHAGVLLLPLSPLLTTFTLMSQALWMTLIVLPLLGWIVPRLREPLTRVPYKQATLLCGVMIHAGIALLLNLTLFSLIIFTSYLGLLLNEDFDALRRWLNRGVRKKVTVFFDAHCVLCRRTMAFLTLCDWLKRLNVQNLHNPSVAASYVPPIPFESLQKAMHVLSPQGTLTVGYDGLVTLAWHLPPLWPLAPFLSLPGISHIGRRVYNIISRNRTICSEECKR